jgi:phage gp29-like protein
MGPAAWGLFPEGTELSLVENTKGDAFNVFDRRIDRANSEISKCILGQTMTLDSGSSYSQSEVHLTVLKNIVERDADMVRDIVNGRLLPLMEKHGFKVSGVTFNWANDTQYTPEQQLQMEQMLLNAGYEIDPKYFSDKYGVPVKGRKAMDNGQLKIDNGQLTVDSFFA